MAQRKQEGFFSTKKSQVKPFFAPTSIQAKLEIGQPNDPYEREADKVADQVMRMPNLGMPVNQGEEVVQRNSLVQRNTAQNGGGQTASPEISSKISSTRGSGNPLPKNTKNEMGSKIGADFSGVKIHTDNNAVQLSQDLGAKAFTVGNDVYFNKGQYKPSCGEGKRLMAHELVHTLQQGGIAAKRTSNALIRKKGDSELQGRGVRETGSGELMINRNTGSLLEVQLYNFDIEGFYLKENHKEMLDNFVYNISEIENQVYGVVLEGMTSKTGSEEFNRQLRSLRAKSVKEYLNQLEFSFPIEITFGSNSRLSEERELEDERDRAVRIIVLMSNSISETEAVVDVPSIPEDVDISLIVNSLRMTDEDMFTAYTAATGYTSRTLLRQNFSLRNPFLIFGIARPVSDEEFDEIHEKHALRIYLERTNKSLDEVWKEVWMATQE